MRVSSLRIEYGHEYEYEYCTVQAYRPPVVLKLRTYFLSVPQAAADL